MNAKAKGRRAEYKSRRVLESLGFYVVRSAGSKGLFGLVGISPTSLMLLQVKCNSVPSPAERQAIKDFAAPPNAQKLIHIWKDHARQPETVEL